MSLEKKYMWLWYNNHVLGDQQNADLLTKFAPESLQKSFIWVIVFISNIKIDFNIVFKQVHQKHTLMGQEAPRSAMLAITLSLP